MTAVTKVISHYGGLIGDDRKLLIVLVTDESGDDGDYVEEARQAAVNRDVPIYVIGRQSLFGTGHLTILYTDPVTKDTFWVGIRRGPETADVEALQYDGLHIRWDELPSGFAPYELARLAKDSGGIYFLLPSEEGLRIKRREKAYSIETLKEYVPDYESRAAYLERREKSEFRRTLYDDHPGDQDVPLPPPLPGLPRPAPPGDRGATAAGHDPAQHPDRDREAAPPAREAPQPRAREALAGRLRPDARTGGRLSDQGLRVPGQPPGDGEEPAQAQADAQRPSCSSTGPWTTRTR